MKAVGAMNMFKRLAAAVAAAVLALTALAIPTEVSADSVLLGDINNDGTVSMVDLTNLNKYLAGQIELVDYVRADLNENCVVDSLDAYILSSYLVSAITSLPYTGYGGGSSYASIGAASVNSNQQYTVFDAATGVYEYSYALGANAVKDNSRTVVGVDTRYGDNSISGVVKIITTFTLQDGFTSNSYGTGFVVDEHTIATAGHVVFNKDFGGSFANTMMTIDKIMVFDGSGNVALEITDVADVHIPSNYISLSESEGCPAYDYALITVSESLSDYANFNLGIMTDGMVSDSETVYCTGFPSTIDDGSGLKTTVNTSDRLHAKYTGSGLILSDASITQPTRRFCHSIDTASGNSGGPVYLKTRVGNSMYYTVIGIHTKTVTAETSNGGVQMTTELLHFYKNNPNIEWG